MVKKSSLLCKTLVVGVIVLLCGMSFVSSTVNIPSRNHSYSKNQVDISNSIGDNDTTPPTTWHILFPLEPDGENGWYIDIPDITICAEDIESGVKVILVSIDGGAWNAFPGGNPGNCISSLVFTEDTSRLNIKYSAIDNAGNTAPSKSFTIYIDAYKPSINVDWDVKIKGLSWIVRFNCEAKDWESGMDRVEMYINDVLQFTINGSGPTYEFFIRYSSIVKSFTFKFIAFDIAGHSAFTLVNGSDIENHPCTKSFSYPHSNNVWLQSLINRFLFLDVLLQIMNLKR